MRTLDHDIAPLGKQGARGVLFRVTLGGYGYTFVAKGTVLAFVDDLKHEALVYRRLQPLQGVSVPVFLGAVDLERSYYYDFRVRIIHMMFLSWGGDRLDDGNMSADIQQRRSRELVRSVRDVHKLGVLHGDVREPNALWNSEARRVMLVDFERAVLVDTLRPPLSHIGLNPKRKRSSGMAQPGEERAQCSMKVEIQTAKRIIWYVRHRSDRTRDALH